MMPKKTEISYDEMQVFIKTHKLPPHLAQYLELVDVINRMIIAVENNIKAGAPTGFQECANACQNDHSS